jgi:hypothetical protein
MISFRLAVQVVADETDMPLPGLFVKAYDRDLMFDDLLGGAVTDREGRVSILSEQGDFAEFFDRRPDVYFKVYAPDRTRLLIETSEAVRWNADRDSSFTVRVPLDTLHGVHADPGVKLGGEPGPDGQPRPPAVGDSLLISAVGLAPAAAHDIEVSDESGPLFVSRLMTDSFGSLPESVLWPQFGLDDPHSDEILSVEEAERRWQGTTLTVRVRRDNRVLAEGSTRVGRFDQPFVMNTGDDDRMLNSFEDGEREVVLSGFNVRHHGEVRAYLVPSQQEWRTGDPIEPVALRDGSLAVADARPAGDGHFRVSLAGAGTIAPGAYDFIVRRIRYGYEDDEDLILRVDDIATRRVTGVVIRQEFWASKVVRLGCVNMLQLAGRPLYERPYFRYGDAFAEGEDVWAAIDPAALPPVKIGKMVAIYVVASKTAAQWNADTSLTHLASLGGNGAVLKIKTQAGCINYNKVLVWPAASTPGAYDIVLDFGNNQSDPMLFAPDNTYTVATPPQNGDIIDGYMITGFRIVKDPGVYTDPAFAYVGGFDYVNDGSLAVIDDDGFSTTVPLTARVRFPANIAGATLPSQISAAKASYPMTIIVHGNGHTFEAYNYLLDHWAANGFIAASIHLNGGQTATDRAKVLFAHINKLKTKFGSKAANNVGIMGHSRGGEGVATVPRLNQQGGLGHNLNAVISLAPTNQHVNEFIVAPWATPYYVIYGSLDADVTGEGVPPLRNCGFALYDKADGARKAMLFVYGATHDRFLAPPGNVDLDYSWLSPSDRLNALSANAHHAIAQAYMTAYFRQQLLNDPQYGELFTGEWVPPSVAIADGGKAKLFSQFRETPGAANRRVVDDFEGPHTATSWQSSTIGGAVSQAGLVANPTENFLYVADNTASPHEASGLVLRWDSPGDKLEFTVPAAQKDVTGFQVLSFRVTQKYDPTGTVNPANTDQDFYVMLRDTGGNERAVRVAKFGRVPYPHIRGIVWSNPVIKSALCTIRVPLHAFTIESAGAQRVNLSQVEKIGFLYQTIPNGEIEIDDVEFSQ